MAMDFIGLSVGMGYTDEKVLVMSEVPLYLENGYYDFNNLTHKQFIINNLLKSVFYDCSGDDTVWISNSVLKDYDVNYILYDENENIIYPLSGVENSGNNIDLKVDIPSNCKYISVNSRYTNGGILPKIKILSSKADSWQWFSNKYSEYTQVATNIINGYHRVNNNNVNIEYNNAFKTVVLNCNKNDKFLLSTYVPSATGLSVVIFLNNETVVNEQFFDEDVVWNEHEIIIPDGTNKVIINYRVNDNIQFSVRKYEFNINNSLELRNLKYGALGDSITFGAVANTNYGEIVAAQLSLNYVNYGISGGRVASTDYDDEVEPMVTRYKNMSDDLDIITVLGGTNDMNANVPLGTDDSSDITTFKGALNVLCKGLVNKYVGKRIGFITPPQRIGRNEDLKAYVEAIKTICSKYSIPVLDLYNSGGIYADQGNWIEMGLLQDGLHPSDKGHKVIARHVNAFVKTL